MEDEAIEKQIEATIDKVRPFLQRDGGDIDFIWVPRWDCLFDDDRGLQRMPIRL